MNNYHTINEDQARNAKRMISHDPYHEGSATQEYRALVNEARSIAERQKQRVDPMYHEKISRILSSYERKLAENMNHFYAIGCRYPSVNIAGASNFQNDKKRKQNAAYDSNMREYKDIQELLTKIQSVGMGGISSDDPNAIVKLKEKLAGLVQMQETMKQVNTYYRKHGTCVGCPLIKEETARKLDEQIAAGIKLEKRPFPSYSLSNNNAEIHRLDRRIKQLEQKAGGKFDDKGWTFEGGSVVMNAQANRIQILFDEKPDEQQRNMLKRWGFRWAPSASAWQRQLTGNGLYAAKSIPFIQPSSQATDDIESEVEHADAETE